MQAELKDQPQHTLVIGCIFPFEFSDHAVFYLNGLAISDQDPTIHSPFEKRKQSQLKSIEKILGKNPPFSEIKLTIETKWVVYYGSVITINPRVIVYTLTSVKGRYNAIVCSDRINKEGLYNIKTFIGKFNELKGYEKKESNF